MDLVSVIRSKIQARLSIGNDDSFYIFDLEDVRLKYRKWIEKIPRVTPFYAIKCNHNQELVKVLANLGTGFDCASKTELQQALNLGVQSHKIIYANTVKQHSHLKYAADNGIDMLTFDCPAELEKIKTIHPNAKVVLRIRFDAKSSLLCLGVKFGCDPIIEAPNMIKMCKDLKINLIGISFHVGSGTLDYEVYEHGLQAIRQLFDVAKDFGFELDFVDIGGGFMGDDINLLENYAKYINQGIEKYFPDPNVTIIAEPGRYFSQSAFILVVQVILKKISNDGHVHYYINDGIYQSFIIARSTNDLQFKIIRKSGNSNETKEIPSTIWGQVCNSKDKIIDNRMIPELEVGDFLMFNNMGAYTMTLSTHFNGFQIGDIITIN